METTATAGQTTGGPVLGNVRHARLPQLLAASLAIAALCLGAHATTLPTRPRGGPPASTPAPPQTEEAGLVRGSHIGRELSPGERHLYRADMAAGQFLRVMIERQGIGATLTLRAPGGKALTQVVGADQPWSSAWVSVLTDVAGSFSLEVQAPEQVDAGGRFALDVVVWRPEAPGDRERLAADRALAEASRLRQGGTAEARRQALDLCSAALRHYHSAGDRLGEAAALAETGRLHLQLGQLRQALVAFSGALEGFRVLEERVRVAEMLNNMGLVQLHLGELPQALEHFQGAVDEFRVMGRRQREAAALSNLGQVHFRLGDSQRALQLYHEALPLFRAVGDRRGEATVLSSMGRDTERTGEPGTALAYYREALAIWQACGDRSGEADTLGNTGRLCWTLGQPQRALDYLEEARQIHSALGEERREARDQTSLALIRASLGQWQEALELLTQALATHRRLGHRPGEGIVLGILGEVHLALGEHDEARTYYEQALELHRAMGVRRFEAAALHSLGRVHGVRAEWEDSLSYLQQALGIYEILQDRGGQAATLGALAELNLARGAPKAAMDALTEALGLCRETGDRESEAMVLMLIGHARLEVGRTAAALATLHEAQDLARALGNRLLEARVLGFIAEAESDSGHLTAALGQSLKAIGLADSLRGALGSRQLRASFLGSAQDFYEPAIALSMALHEQKPEAGYDATALELSERARARSLLDTLAEARLDPPVGVPPEFIARKHALQDALNAQEQERIHLESGAPTEAETEGAERALQLTRTELQVVEGQIRAASAKALDPADPRPLALAEIQAQVLDADTLMLEYSLGAEKSFGWVVTTDAISTFSLPPRETIEEATRNVYELLTARNRRPRGESPRQRRERIAHADADFLRAGADLSRMLLGPVAGQLGAKRLLVVADGALHYLPFAALPVPGPPGGERADYVPLLRRHEVVCLPSASALSVLRSQRSRRAAAPKAVAVLADPVFRRDDPRVAQMHRTAPGDRPATVSDGMLLRSAAESGVTSFHRLRFSRREAESIARQVPPGQCLQALDFDASRATVIEGGLDQYRVIHIASHGLLNSRHPELSGIVLSLVDANGVPVDGFLRLHEIHDLRLNADLVVLSGCRTALGREIRGEGLLGLTRGFLHAGAAQVIASLWSVQDRATADLMSRFYRVMLNEEGRPAAALRAAQLTMNREPRWQAPYYWAPFVIQGDWR